MVQVIELVKCEVFRFYYIILKQEKYQFFKKDIIYFTTLQAANAKPREQGSSVFHWSFASHLTYYYNYRIHEL